MSLCVLAAAALWATRNGYYAPQGGGIGHAREFAAQARPRMLIGNTDAGRFAYFGRDEVVNLDGIVNNEALKHIRAGRLCDYLFARRFDLIMMTPDRYDFYNRNVVTEPAVELPPAAPAPEVVAGRVDTVYVEPAGGGTATVRIEGWVSSSDCDAASTYPLIALLDAQQVPLAVFSGKRGERMDVAHALADQHLRYAGCRFALPREQLPAQARFVRLGAKLREGTLWTPAAQEFAPP